MNSSATMEQTEVLRVKLAVLKQEHRDLDDAIHALHERGVPDMLTLQRLKRRRPRLAILPLPSAPSAARPT